MLADFDGNLKYINEYAAIAHGYTVIELNGRNLSIFHNEDQIPRIMELNNHLKEAGNYTAEEVWHTRKDGSVFPTLMSASVFRNEFGDPLFLSATLIDITERKEMEHNLKEEIDKAQKILDLADVMLIELNKKGIITLINKKGIEILNYSEDEIVGKNFFDNFLLQEERTEVKRLFNGLMKGEIESVEYYENSIITKGRIERIVRWHNTLIYDKKGKIIGTMSFGEDITERKKAEQKLKESEQQYRSTINALGDPLHVIDENYKIILINESLTNWVKKLNLDVEILGKTPKEAWPFLPDLIMEEYRSIFNSGNPVITVENTPIGNREITTETRKIPIFNEEKVIQIITVMRDITENKEVKQKLKDSEDIYRLLAEQLAAEKERLSVTLKSIGDGVITTDRDGLVVFINQAAEDLTGFKQGEGKGKPIEDIFRVVSEESGKAIEPITRILSTESIVNLSEPMILTSKYGEKFIINDSGAPIRDKDSQVIGIVLVFRDITEQRRIETELFKNQRIESIGMLAGGIAHDFNNILTSITGNFSLIKLDLEKNSNNYQFLLEAESGVNQATGLARQLLTFSKGGEPIKEKAIIEKIIEESSSFSIRGSGIDLKINKRNEDDLWSVNIDKSQIGQVIQNLVINAIQAMESKGTIVIGVTNVSIKTGNQLSLVPGYYVKVDVIDKGCGISPEILPKIFDLYFTTKPKGSGLGLSICHSIIRQHGGIITVDSKIDEGSTFTFYIPSETDVIVANIKRPELLLDNVKEEIKRFNILILEDEEVVCRILDSMLNRLNIRGKITNEGSETYREYKNSLKSGKPYDLVILDLTIPGGMGGEETMKKLLELDPSVKAIVSSGYAVGKILSDYQQYGFKGVLVKPYTVKEFVEIIQKLLI